MITQEYLDNVKETVKTAALNKFASGDMLQYFQDNPDKAKAYDERRKNNAKSKRTRNITKTAQPTPAQAKAGNYKKGHIRYNALDISIENPAGSVRSGVSESGKKWSNKMQHHYGYIKKTMGHDKDHVDVFIKPGTKGTETVYIINQFMNGKFDEHKCMLGFDSKEEARKAYLSNYDKGWDGIDSIATMSVAELKNWVYDGRKMKPAKTSKTLMKKKAALDAVYYRVYKEELQKIAAELSGDESIEKVAVSAKSVWGMAGKFFGNNKDIRGQITTANRSFRGLMRQAKGKTLIGLEKDVTKAGLKENRALAQAGKWSAIAAKKENAGLIERASSHLPRFMRGKSGGGWGRDARLLRRTTARRKSALADKYVDKTKAGRIHSENAMLAERNLRMPSIKSARETRGRVIDPLKREMRNNNLKRAGAGGVAGVGGLSMMGGSGSSSGGYY